MSQMNDLRTRILFKPAAAYFQPYFVHKIFSGGHVPGRGIFPLAEPIIQRLPVLFYLRVLIEMNVVMTVKVKKETF